jgi:hypothetical protein
MFFSIRNEETNHYVKQVFNTLPIKERKQVNSIIAAVTDADLTTAIRPFGFGGKVVHELYFDPNKLRRFDKNQKVGAVVAAFIIASLSLETKGRFPLDNRTLRTRSGEIMNRARRWRYAGAVSSFLKALNFQEDEWNREVTEVSIKKIEEGIRAVKKKLKSEKDLNRKVTDIRSTLRTDLDLLASWARNDLELCSNAEGKEKEKLYSFLIETKNLKREVASRKT